jgi:hypothetical protein
MYGTLPQGSQTEAGLLLTVRRTRKGLGETPASCTHNPSQQTEVVTLFGDTLFKQSKLEIIEQLHGSYLKSRHWHIVGRDGPLVVIERDDNKLRLSLPVGQAMKGNFGRLL